MIRGRKLKIIVMESTAIGWNDALDVLALHADQLHVLASIDAAWKAAQDSCEVEQAASPGNRHTPDLTTGDVGGVCSTELAGSAVVAVVVDVDDSGPGLAVHRLAIHGGRSSICRLLAVAGLSISGLSIAGLSVGLLSVHIETFY